MFRGNLRCYGFILILLFTFGCGEKKEEAAKQPAAEAAKPTATGTIAGKVSFTGTAPKSSALRMNADPVCVKQHTEPVYGQEVVVNKNSTLKYVLVFVKEGLGSSSYPTPSDTVIFDQKGCMYTPHVLGIQVDQDFEVRNSDPTLHNVHSLSKDNPTFNLAQPKQGMKFFRKFEKPEVFHIKCEVHNWMSAYVGVFNHPYYAVTGDDGTFEIKGVPQGEYTVEAWHEKYGPKTMKVTVGPGAAATADFAYQGS